MAGEVADHNRRFFVAVHVGAGYHSPSNEKALRSAMKRACLAASSLLRQAATPEMLEFMQKLRNVVTVGVVGGSDLVKISEQLGKTV